MDLTHSENIILRYILDNPSYVENCKADFFKNSGFQDIFNLGRKFWEKYNESPTAEQLKEGAKLDQKDLQPGEVDAVYNVDLTRYQDDWLKETTELFIEYKNLVGSAVDGVKYIQTTQVTSENIKDVISTFKNIVVERNNIDFSFDHGLDFFHPESHKQLTYNRFSSGFPFIDTVLGGGFNGLVCSICAFDKKPKIPMLVINIRTTTAVLRYAFNHHVACFQYLCNHTAVTSFPTSNTPPIIIIGTAAAAKIATRPATE